MSMCREAGAIARSITDIGGYGSPPSRGTTKMGVVSNRKSNLSQLPRIRERKRRDPPGVLIENKRAGDRRFGALAAVFTLAQPAVDTDRRALGFFQIHAGGVNQARRMADLATEPNGKTRLWLRVRRHRPAHHLRDRKITRAVRQLDHLFQAAVRRVEGRVHVPQRTGAAEFRKRKRAGGKSL